jgi:TPR repeat protein
MIRWLVIIGCSLALGAAAQAQTSTLKSANEAYDRGDHSSALSAWQGLAKDGHPLAAYRLGRHYRSGKGVTPNPKRALEWFLLAARQRLAAAYYQIGLMHLAGEHVVKDIAAAWAHFKTAARLGDSRGVAMTGHLGTRMDALELWRGRQMSKGMWPAKNQAKNQAKRTPPAK